MGRDIAIGKMNILPDLLIKIKSYPPWDQDLLPLNSIKGNPKTNRALDCSRARGLLSL